MNVNKFLVCINVCELISLLLADWTSLLRREIKNTYTDEMIREADEELRQLVRRSFDDNKFY